MKPLSALLFLALLPSFVLASPAMVTTARGSVQLLTETGAAQAPAPPFLLMDGQQLKLSDRAEVVLLYEGIASHLVGPKDIALADLSTGTGASGGSSALDDLMSKAVVTRRAAASRGPSDFALTRPVAGTVVLQPHTIRWSCEKCAAVTVEVYDFMNDETLWTATGTAQLAYAGPTLKPGGYAVVIDGRDFPFTVPSAEDAASLNSAQAGAKKATAAIEGSPLSAADQAAITATVYLQAGHATEALQAIEDAQANHPDDAELQALLEEFERRTGLRE